MRTKALFGVMLGFIAPMVAGCASVIMENTSPTKIVPDVRPFETIQGTILVKPGKPGDAVQNDVVEALKAAHVFTRATTSLDGGEAALAELTVTFEDDDDSHFGAEIMKAVLIGLTLCTTEGVAADKHDHTTTVHAILSKGGRELATYHTTGSFHSEMPENRSIPDKVDHVKKNVELSWEHALGLLVAAIKQDRSKIVAP